MSTGPRGNRVYFGYGTGANGIVQIVDREKLLKGPKEPTQANLVYPQVARLDLPPDVGAHTAFPLLGMQLTEFARQKLRPGSAAAAGVDHDHGDAAPDRTQARRDFIAAVGETTANECLENRQMVRMLDITTEPGPGERRHERPAAGGRRDTRGELADVVGGAPRGRTGHSVVGPAALGAGAVARQHGGAAGPDAGDNGTRGGGGGRVGVEALQ